MSSLFTKIYQAIYRWNQIQSASQFQHKLKCLAIAVLARLLRIRYWFVKLHLRRIVKVQKLKVLFVIGDECKWKAQKLYEAMIKSSDFDPYVVVTPMDIGWIDDRLQDERMLRCAEFLQNRGIRVIMGVDRATNKVVSLSDLKPAIVIYQQPWGMYEMQNPIAVSASALTFYLPYYLRGFMYSTWPQHGAPVFRTLYATFIDNQEYVDYLCSSDSWLHAGCRYIANSLPFVDEIIEGNSRAEQKNVVIYAPHWGFEHPNNEGTDGSSTFLDTGKFILKFAQEHPEIHWVFKPHPMLKIKLEQCNVWTKDEIDNYYSQWEELGEGYYSGNYLPYFYSSRAMITDCDSFLTEYLLCNKPLIRLETKKHLGICECEKLKLSAYYRAQNQRELTEILKLVIEERKDPMKSRREEVLKILGCDGTSATSQILTLLRREIGF